MSASLRLCGYCKSWRGRPCGEGCYLQPTDPAWPNENHPILFDRDDLGSIFEAFDEIASEVGGCSDGFCCVTGKASGMHTNGGCRCWTDKMKAQRMMMAGRKLRDDLARAAGLTEDKG